MNPLLTKELFDNLNISPEQYSVMLTITLDPTIVEKVGEKIGIAISKRRGNALTKRISAINKTGKITFGYGKSQSKVLDFEVGLANHNNNKLKQLTVNVVDCLIGVSQSEFTTKFLHPLTKLRSQNLRDKSAIEAEDTLARRKEILDIQEEMIDAIDYDKLIDRAFFVYVKWLVDAGLHNKKVRDDFFVQMTRFHFALVKDILLNTNHEFKPEQIPMLKTIIVYSFVSIYSNFTGTKLLSLIAKHPDFDPETARTIKDVAPDFKNTKGLGALAYLLANVGILNVSQGTLMGLMERIYGDEVLGKLYESQFSSFVTYLSVMNDTPTLPRLMLPREIDGIENDMKEAALRCKRFTS